MFPSATSGLYAIKYPCAESDRLSSVAKLTVYCDMETDGHDGGGWIVIQRRNASMGWVNFVRNWADYEKGFGDLDSEFWIGLETIYELTKQGPMQMQVSVWNESNNAAITWNYLNFQVSGPDQYYALSNIARSGSGDGSYGAFYSGSSSIRFSTYDRDYDSYGDSCAYVSQGGWWYYNCGYANPNGRHRPTNIRGVDPLRQRLVWRTTASTTYNIYTNSEMRIRPRSCT